MLWRLRARSGYLLSRQLFHWRGLMRQPRIWRWMEGQFARMANLGDIPAQSFYGHLLLFRGQGLGARQEGRRLLGLAAAGGDAKAAYQLGVLSLAGDTQHEPDAAAAARWWEVAAAAGHPLAAHRLAELYRDGSHGLEVDPVLSARYSEQARQLGFLG